MHRVLLAAGLLKSQADLGAVQHSDKRALGQRPLGALHSALQLIEAGGQYSRLYREQFAPALAKA